MAPERADGMVFAVAKRTIRRITPLELGRRDGRSCLHGFDRPIERNLSAHGHDGCAIHPYSSLKQTMVFATG